jgi:Ca2+-binding RTX toxin-like protein
MSCSLLVSVGLTVELRLVEAGGSATVVRIQNNRSGSFSLIPNGTTISGAEFVDLTLGGGADTFWGLSGRDIAHGAEGNDVLNGLGGDDELSGGPGADLIDGGDGNDTIDGGGGTDTLTYAITTGVLDFTTAVYDTTDGLTLSNGAVIRNIEVIDVAGASGDDTFTMTRAGSFGSALRGGGSDLLIADFSTAIADFNLVGSDQFFVSTFNGWQIEGIFAIRSQAVRVTTRFRAVQARIP